jgi:arsenate reductase (glutaredoxin)
MLKMIHNPLCSKSREVIRILDEHKVSYHVIYYKEGELNLALLSELLSVLKVRPRDIIRTHEEGFKKLTLDLDNDLLVKQAIVDYPQILERPIIWDESRGVVGRPPEIVLSLLS